jgi:hypothetical protein
MERVITPVVLSGLLAVAVTAALATQGLVSGEDVYATTSMFCVDITEVLPPFSRGKYESEVSTFQGRITSFGSSFVAFPSSSVDFDI